MFQGMRRAIDIVVPPISAALYRRGCSGAHIRNFLSCGLGRRGYTVLYDLGYAIAHGDWISQRDADAVYFIRRASSWRSKMHVENMYPNPGAGDVWDIGHWRRTAGDYECQSALSGYDDQYDLAVSGNTC